jgi:RimJ/RimL family protein N-acetyltransferase
MTYQPFRFELPLTGDRLSLVPFELSDLERLAAFFAEPGNLYYYLPDTLLPRNRAQLLAMMEDWNDGKENFVFTCRYQDQPIGLLTVSDLDPVAGKAELGIMLAGEESRGKGLAFEAMELILAYAFGELRLHRLYARVAPGNEPSVRLFQKLGFKEEGRIRDAMRRGDGYVDLLLFGLLEDEYRMMKKI